MSRESAYRLRRRDPAGLFAAAWDRAMAAGRVTLTHGEVDEGHRRVIARACGAEGPTIRSHPRHNQFRDLPPDQPPAMELPRISSIHRP